MSSSNTYAALLEGIRAHAPSEHREADLPLTISQRRAEEVLHVVHDVGGQPDGPLDKSLHKTALWEKRTHCTAECLAWRGVWVSEERRRRENDLGETLYFGTPYYARWLLATTKMLIDKGHITPDELIAKMEEVRRREEDPS
jgi:thiocyanate hydrolase subunit beta